MEFGQVFKFLQRVNAFLLDVADEGKGARLRTLIKDSAGNIGTSLSGFDLAGANLSGIDLRGVDLREADLEEACLQHADLSCSNLEGANLRWADLKKAKLKYANLKRADLRGANVSGADFSQTNLEDADIKKSIVAIPYPDVGTLYKDFLVRKQINGTKFDKDTQWPDNFDPLKAGAIFEDA